MNRLIVCVPGLSGSTSAWSPLLSRLLAEPQLAGSEVRYFNHHCRIGSHAFAEDIADELAATVTGYWVNKKDSGAEYDDIIFLAHSAGSLLTRYAFLYALGDSSRPREDWTSKVSRMVLFAGLNRGLCAPPYDPRENAPYELRRRFIKQTLEIAGELPAHFFAEDFLAGSDFVSKVRLGWIRSFRNLNPQPIVVQAVGTRDTLVRRSDSIDVEQFPAGHQVSIPGANHRNIIEIENEEGFLPERYALIRHAVLAEFPDSHCEASDTEGSPIIFIVHGIRATNRTWVDEAKKILKSALPNATIVPATYWYFSALDFVLPLIRKRRTRWFKDVYTYFCSRNPLADFHFIGHSNGTYLLGHSLRTLPHMHFRKVILAGSVLPKTFDWRRQVRSQVDQVWNHRAQLDVPVGILCSALSSWMKDVGTAGYEGFEPLPEIHECFYHPGGHGAAVAGGSLPCVLLPLLGGQATEPCEPRAEEAHWFSWLSRRSRILPWVCGLTLFSGSYYCGGILNQQFGLSIAVSMLCILAGLVGILGMILAYV